jgi:hypothetical protein
VATRLGNAARHGNVVRRAPEKTPAAQHSNIAACGAAVVCIVLGLSGGQQPLAAGRLADWNPDFFWGFWDSKGHAKGKEAWRQPDK